MNLNSLIQDLYQESYWEKGIRNISFYSCQKLSKIHSLKLREVEVISLKHEILPSRYRRNYSSFTLSEQLKLLESSLALVGLGGLGGYLLELFARIGVGRIEAADGDCFEDHNLNRQLLCTEQNLGSYKAYEAYERINRVNSAVEFKVRNRFLEEKEFQSLIKNKNVCIDALGDLKVRRKLLNVATELGVPVVTGAVAGEMGFVSTVYPGQEHILSLWEGQIGAEGPLGCPPHSVCTIASIQCSEAVNLLCGRLPSLRGKIGVIDLHDLQWQVYTL